VATVIDLQMNSSLLWERINFENCFLTMDIACPGPDLQVVFKLRFHNTYNLQTSEVMSLMPSTEFQI